MLYACAGRVTQWCERSNSRSHAIALRVGLSILGVLVASAVVAFCSLRWKQVVREFSAARIARIKRRWGARALISCPVLPRSALPYAELLLIALPLHRAAYCPFPSLPGTAAPLSGCLPCPALPCPYRCPATHPQQAALSSLGLPCSALLLLIWRHSALLCSACLELPCLGLPCLELPCPALPCPALPCPAFAFSWLPRLRLPYLCLCLPLPCHAGVCLA